MNIFYLDRDIKKCAQSHCDKHVNKMILEGAQLLASAIRLTHHNPDTIPGLYKLTHKNHPDSIWVRSSINNYLYLRSLIIELNEECQYRYGHRKTHVSLLKVYNWPIPNLPDVPFFEPPKCVHDDWKKVPDVVEAYRGYYNRDKRGIATWKRREIPDWYII